jgi:hypothetical protein
MKVSKQLQPFVQFFKKSGTNYEIISADCVQVRRYNVYGGTVSITIFQVEDDRIAINMSFDVCIEKTHVKEVRKYWVALTNMSFPDIRIVGPGNHGLQTILMGRFTLPTRADKFIKDLLDRMAEHYLPLAAIAAEINVGKMTADEAIKRRL